MHTLLKVGNQRRLNQKGEGIFMSRRVQMLLRAL